MAEYIEREAALRECQNAIFVAIAQKHYFDEFCINLKQKITKMPAADVVEVRRGKWVKDTKTADVCAEYRCSFCGFMYCEADPKYPPYKYCPECGANNE